jgi:hypothetical protein
VNKQDVFINGPFEKPYERIFLALIAGLVGLNLRPRSVLQIDTTHDRVRRIWGLLRKCQYFIHDLSKVQLSRKAKNKAAFSVPRFNMPFETGLAVALAQTTTHEWKILEEKPYRIQQSCSDLNGHEAFIHDRSPEVLLRELLTAFLGQPGEEAVLRLKRTSNSCHGLRDPSKPTPPPRRATVLHLSRGLIRSRDKRGKRSSVADSLERGADPARPASVPPWPG